MDAIECGIVKLPRVPVADNIPGGDMPMFRESVGAHRHEDAEEGPRQVRRSSIRSSLPAELQTALEALYGHYAKTFELWEKAGIDVPPVFIVVCNNTATSKLVYDYISGFVREERGRRRDLRQRPSRRCSAITTSTATGSPRPNTLLIDSEQLESGEALDDEFRDDGRGRDRALPPRDRAAHRRCAGRREDHRPGPAARGHEHGRQARDGSASRSAASSRCRC